MYVTYIHHEIIIIEWRIVVEIRLLFQSTGGSNKAPPVRIALWYVFLLLYLPPASIQP